MNITNISQKSVIYVFPQVQFHDKAQEFKLLCEIKNLLLQKKFIHVLQSESIGATDDMYKIFALILKTTDGYVASTIISQKIDDIESSEIYSLLVDHCLFTHTDTLEHLATRIVEFIYEGCLKEETKRSKSRSSKILYAKNKD